MQTLPSKPTLFGFNSQKSFSKKKPWQKMAKSFANQDQD
jgi:hypothetical protein